ncbi:hypothetical protein CO641_04805 [Lysobacteraceae bacterium NML91-0213]|nr:hypothetical protein CO641_04805 [Xanthomonadaceae bacterium NML91-0213]
MLSACLLVAVLAPAPGHAAQDGVGNGISRELAEARREVRADLARARMELRTGNLDVAGSLRVGGTGDRAAPTLPKAEITPDGDFLVDGEAVAIDPTQRRHLLDYRSRVVGIGLAGIDIGERSTELAIDAVDRGVFRLVVAAMTGSLERQLEKRIATAVESDVRGICDRLPALYASQQRLADSLPAFRPYATMTIDEASDCERQVRREFARR